MPTSTTNFGLSKPLVNDPTDQDLWGNELNSDLDSIDTLLLRSMEWLPSAKTTSFSVAAPTSGSTTLGDFKTVFMCDTTGGTITASLPTAASAGAGFTVGFKNLATNALTITPNGTEKIDGVSPLTLSAKNDWVVLYSNGTNWYILSIYRQMQQPKGWGYFTLSGTTVTLGDSYGLSSIVRLVPGVFQVNFSTAFTSTNYGVLVTGGVNTAGTTWLIGVLDNTTKLTVSCQIRFVNPGTNATDDVAQATVMVLGKQ